jgi:multisubunit Na+/H+ antiporter MnhF subunit
MNAFTIAATALLAGFLPCGVVLARAREPIDAVVALELCGAVAVLVLLCLGQGFNASTYFNVPVVAAAVTWISGLIFARFLGRRL